ncbi:MULTISPECIES: hypothetical protein [Methylobacterium]|uniref:hypothetical protein n=1 Tax=Methylobacterium TaxID=407 RepID=UPI0013ED9F1F|nr:hypothetical protein [Methylobacterium sp. DB0501]NGM35352.1 hypothetical protein [Methylobacterium sp. DB0501]
MTVNAAYRVGTVPVLISDFLVTTEPGRARSIDLPSFPNISEVTDPLTGVSMVGLQRKSAVIGNSIAITGSGNAASIKQIINRLSKYMQKDESIDILKDYLGTQTEFKGARCCILVGHHVGQKISTFRWDSATGVFAAGLGFVEGSGAEMFRSVVPFFDQQGDPHPDYVFDRCVEDTLHVTATLYANEIAHGNTLERHFGGGYDVFIYVDGMFRRIEEVVYLFYRLKILGPDTMRVYPQPVYIKNMYFGDVGFIISFLTDSAVRRNAEPHQRVARIEPLITGNHQVPNIPIESISLNSPKIAIGFLGEAITGEEEVFTAVVQGDEARQFNIFIGDKWQGKLREVRFECPEIIMNNISQAAFLKFIRKTAEEFLRSTGVK